MLQAFRYEHGTARRLGDTESPRSAVWIDLLSATDAEVEQVEQATGLTLPSRASLEEIEVSSRLAARDGVLFLSMPMLSMVDGPRAVPAGFVLAHDRLITIRYAQSRTFDALAKQLPEIRDATPCGGHILITLLEGIVDRQADALEQMRAEFNIVSKRIFAMGEREAGGRKNEDALLRQTLGDLGRHGEMISFIRETLVGSGRIAPYVEQATADWMPHDLRARLKSVHEDVLSLNDFNTHLNDKLQFLLDATLGFINIAQNNVMKVMTIASVVGIPPVLVAGIYGMNFKNMPEYDWAWGYAWGWALIVITTMIPLLAFRWRKWI